MDDFKNQLVNIPKWKIKGYGYFTVDKKLYNSRTRRFLKKRVTCSSIGYELDGVFITLTTLRPLLIKINRLSKNNLKICRNQTH